MSNRLPFNLTHLPNASHPKPHSASSKPIALPFSTFSTAQLSDLDTSSASSDDSSDSSSSDADSMPSHPYQPYQPAYRPSGLNVTSFNAPVSTTQNNPTPRPSESNTAPHPCLLGIDNLKSSSELSKSIINRLPADMSAQSWDAWIAERKRRYPRLKPRAQSPPQTTNSNSTTSQLAQPTNPATPKHTVNLLLDDYDESSGDDDAAPIETPLERAVIPDPSPLPNTRTTNPTQPQLQSQTQNPSPQTPQLDTIHTPESNNDETNQYILTHRYPEYLTYLGLHPSIIYLLSSYPPAKLPIFPIFEPAPNPVQYARGKPTHQRPHQIRQDQLNNKDNQVPPKSTTTTRPSKRQVDLGKCTIPDNPFFSLCLTLHQQYGFQFPPPISPPTNNQHDSTQLAQPNQLTPSPLVLYPPPPQPLAIDDILEKCHQKLQSGSLIQINPHRVPTSVSKYDKFKQSRDKLYSSSKFGNREGVLYVDLYKKLISRDLLQETNLILQAFHTILELEFLSSHQ